VDISIRAVGLLRERGVDVRLDIIGDGPERPSLEQLRTELRLERAVSFLGLLPHSELGRTFASVDALVQPSRTAADGDSEGGHPTVILEAQAQALPVISTRHADIPMVVRHGETGLLVSENDVVELADALGAFETLDRHSMGTRARERALRRHRPEKVARLQEAIYRRLQ
jgi:colanic acid/amylovoran biosynthesis glycosyltransferase